MARDLLETVRSNYMDIFESSEIVIVVRLSYGGSRFSNTNFHSVPLCSYTKTPLVPGNTRLGSWRVSIIWSFLPVFVSRESTKFLLLGALRLDIVWNYGTALSATRFQFPSEPYTYR